ncbi:hypothetical protein UKS_04280 [Streptococcus sp. 116-D4]|nr:hypothetical protein UKS_04280 [Streptococcus sp. 116-D4]
MSEIRLELSGKVVYKIISLVSIGRTKVEQIHKKALISRLFPVDLDAPYRDLERTFILRAIKNIEI